EVDFFRRRTLPEALIAQRLLASDVESLPEDLGPRLFPEMDRVLARGPGWCVSLATASKRTRGYETMSGENIKGWHQGSAARYLHLESDQRHYLDWFPTVDPFRMPGTTIDSQFLDDERNSAPTYHGFVGGSQVGGTRLDDGFYDRPLYAAWVQQLSSRDSTMTAKLSWFFLGDLIVCLGADIRGGSGNPIETILENRAITNAATQRLFVDGEYVPEAAEPGWSTTVQQLESFTIDGVASVIAFGGPLTVHLLHEERTGSWSDISARGSTEPHTKRFVTGWLDHGSRPAGAAFSYLYAPLVGAARATELAADPGVELLRNDAEVQGVWSPSRGVTCVNFHQEDTVRAGQSTILGAKETSVSLLHRGNGVLEIAFSAPCQLRTRRRFTIGFPNGWDLAVGHTDATLDVTRRGGEFDIVLDSSALDGRSHHLELVRS
ncbi:MAG TPA: polysaccharide lyase family 8 super-sandwich domain-containing protein, partial [Actinopolymorphaceae bacterium]